MKTQKQANKQQQQKKRSATDLTKVTKVGTEI